MSSRFFTNALPLIARELRAEARRPLNYWLRLLAAGAIVLVFSSVMFTARFGGPQLGQALFLTLHATLFSGFWIIVPLMAADCISREKREGTLGLLFLTPLRVPDVIVAKGTIHALRALTLFLAAVPVLGLPFLLGGVGAPAVVFAVLNETIAVLLGIAAGLYASTKGGTAVQVMVRAECTALVLALIQKVWVGSIGSGIPWGPFGITGAIGLNLGFAIALFVLVVRTSIHRLRDTWHEEPAGLEQPQWVKIFSDSSFWREAFKWNTSRTLDRNPVAWLQEYSWTARLTKWGWCLLLLVAEFVVFLDWDGPTIRTWQPILTMAIALGVAFSAANSFRRERQTGLLEIMLVTPLSVRRLIGGRLWGIFCHYFPALAVLTVCWIGYRLLDSRPYDPGLLALLVPNPVAFAALMLVGLYVSLTRLNLLLAWALSWAGAFILPILVPLALNRLAPIGPVISLVLISTLQFCLMAIAWVLLDRAMRRRTFTLTAFGTVL